MKGMNNRGQAVINADAWMAELLPQLQQTFGKRLYYLGLQGSYRRGEATESSDIDVVVLLESVTLDDLDAYRAIVRAMPEGQKACGFFSSVADMLNWPRHELFAFQKDTADYFGKLENFLPAVSINDAVESARIGASGILHMLTHSYLYAAEDDRPMILQQAYKAAFFVMQVHHCVTTGVYCGSKSQLLPRLEGTDKEIILAGLDVSQWLASHSQSEAFATLLHWCSTIVQTASKYHGAE
jgi:hypothetical protein